MLERLNAERKRAKEREGELVQRLIDRREAFEVYERKLRGIIAAKNAGNAK